MGTIPTALFAILMSLFSAALSSAATLEFQPLSSARYRHFGVFHLFDATFSAPNNCRERDPTEDFPKSLEFVYARKLTRAQLVQAADKILKRSFSETELSAIAKEISDINAAYENVDANDRYTLSYLPAKGTTLIRNGVAVATIPGARFQQIYFSIWLGPDSPFNFRKL